jgi:1-acyl-sn-glycerol-3-phosphate acyltransferase
MLSILLYIFLVLLCTVMLIISAVALLVTLPFDRRRHIVHELSRLLCRIFFAVPPRWSHKVEGLEHIEKGKPYIMLLNHRTMMDIPAAYFLPLDFRWVSKREVFKTPFFGQFLWLHGDICIDRSKGSAAMEKMMRDGKKWTQRGVSVAIFPEGTRSKDGEIHRFKAGAFTLAKEIGVEILPVVMTGTEGVIKPNKMFGWRNRITLTILPSVDPAGRDTKELMEEIYNNMSAVIRHSAPDIQQLCQ